TLYCIGHVPGRLAALGISAHGNIDLALEQARRFQPRWLAFTDPAAVGHIDRSHLSPGTELLFGEEGLRTMASDPETDVVVSAIVGAAGLKGTWAAIEAGKTVALANKETLVVAGPLVMRLARERGATILPVDSEHSAVFQCLASGGAYPRRDDSRPGGDKPRRSPEIRR